MGARAPDGEGDPALDQMVDDAVDAGLKRAGKIDVLLHARRGLVIIGHGRRFSGMGEEGRNRRFDRPRPQKAFHAVGKLQAKPWRPSKLASDFGEKKLMCSMLKNCKGALYHLK